MLEKYEEKTIHSIKSLWKKGYLASGDGNFSFKYLDKIFISPSGCRKCDLKVGDFVELENSSLASSESLMHQKVYEMAPEAQAVFHAHPPAAIALSIVTDKKFIQENLMSELILSVGGIPIADYARPGSSDMAKVIEEYLPKYRALILKHHGVLGWGESIEEAMSAVERVEHSCDILLRVKPFESKTQTLLAEEVEFLKEKRKELGDRVL